MVLTSPLMLLGFLALPVLAAVYWLRSRSRRAVVSSLAFWIDQRRPRRGGRILHRMQAPLAFFLELLAIAMLVSAAAGPALLKRDVVRPLTVVLDDSYSMQARRGATSARDRAETALTEELRKNNYVARFILSGARPRLIGQTVRDPDRAEEVFTQWTGQSPTADLPAAITLATEVGDRTTRILVLSDQPPKMELESSQIQWWAFGEKLPNMAFTAATRNRGVENERVLLELACLADSPGQSKMNIRCSERNEVTTSLVELEGGATKQIFLDLPPDSPVLSASIDADALEIDNQVLLLPESAKPLRVSIDISDKDLRRAVVHALEATGGTIIVSERPELVVCNKSGATNGDAWRMEILGDKEAAAYAGPFVIDHNNALAEGLSLQSVIWSASPKSQPAGLPIVMAGNVPLLTESEDVAGRRCLRMNLAPEQSNLHDSPDWPILFANIVKWRRGGLPGVAAPNVRLGQTLDVVLEKEAGQVEVVSPDETTRKLEVHGRRIATSADRVGLHAIKTFDAEYLFSCNTISRDESDLTDCRSGCWGSWNESPIYQDRQVSLSWVFLVVAIVAMATHLAVIGKRDDGITGDS